jgi:hypothetical protein
MLKKLFYFQPAVQHVALLFLLNSLSSSVQAAISPLAISSAVFNKNSQALVVKATVKGNLSGTLSLLHGDGGLLKQATATKAQQFVSPISQIGQVPCTVEARLNNLSVSKAVTGAPTECKKIPVCKISSPANGANFKVNTLVDFNGFAKPKDPKAKTFSYEWDFGGGVFENSHPTSQTGQVKFARDNSQYRIRFAATDSLKRRCEAAVEISIGTSPIGLPAKASEVSAPTRGNAIPDAQSLVVIPFQEWTMQHFTDMRVQPNGYFSFAPLINNMNAYVFEKGSVGIAKPRFVNADTISLQYSAASNPFDPAGANSINSTSQNWPLNTDPTKPAPLMSSTVQKSDYWESEFRKSTDLLWNHYVSEPLIQFVGPELWLTALPNTPRTDEGYFPHVNLTREAWGTVEDWAIAVPDSPPSEDSLQNDYLGMYKDKVTNYLKLEPAGVTHGRYMPGVDNPYSSNVAQTIPKYDTEQQWHSATLLPITDISDDGRVNPSPLLRFEVVQKNNQAVVTKTDAVLTNSRDFHCRECHAKGQIAANPNATYTKAAFRSSPSGVSGMADMAAADMPTPMDKPDFFSVEDIGGNPNSLFDQEYAAALNYSSTHQFYDGMEFLDHMQKGWVNKKTGMAINDWTAPCYGCHMSALSNVTANTEWAISESYDYSAKNYDPNYSLSMHRFHAEMQYNSDKSDIIRNDKGGYARFDWKNKTRLPNKDINPNSLFPIFDSNGKQLPMEQNCLKCHAGHREQIYNDRMKTAGVTCYDCHGDMLAVGQAFPKDTAKTGSQKHQDYRIPWFDETDCGSCHVGTGNTGKDGSNGFFSAGIKKRAFDDTELAANSRPVIKYDPDSVRFAIVPNYVKEFAMTATRHEPTATDADADGNVTDKTPVKVNAPVYRFGKDQHGNIACAACHGAAHAVGPNRDPKSNDNVTALQLQGYAGPLLECNVCHTKDAFKVKENSGSFLHYPNKDGNPTILAGPHNLHPVNDPYWWKEAPGDAVDSSPNSPKRKGNTIKGGWHNDWAKLPGLKGEDQCAACHGADHKGTRLSKVPVDRELITEKGKKVTIKAGTPVGCDLCHSIVKSCTGSPAGQKCGTQYDIPTAPEPGHQAPVISSKPSVSGLTVGAVFSYQVTAAQVDNLALSYSLVNAPTGMTIDPTSHVITWTAAAVAGNKVNFSVHVKDAVGSETVQALSLTVCTTSIPWDSAMAMCM